MSKPERDNETFVLVCALGRLSDKPVAPKLCVDVPSTRTEVSLVLLQCEPDRIQKLLGIEWLVKKVERASLSGNLLHPGILLTGNEDHAGLR